MTGRGVRAAKAGLSLMARGNELVARAGRNIYWLQRFVIQKGRKQRCGYLYGKDIASIKGIKSNKTDYVDKHY